MKKDAFDLVKSWFESFGYKVLSKPKKQDNDCDMYVVGSKRTLRVEIKRMRVQKNKSWQTERISERQRFCDACAVVFPNDKVMVYSMPEYEKACSEGGYRSYNWLKL